MTTYVLDASVAVKWFLSARDEAFSREALALYQRYLGREIEFIVPDIFWAEVASAFWKAIRVDRIQKTSAQDAIHSMMKCDFPTTSIAALLEKAFHIATTFDRSVYDSLYVALALQSGAQLITADERLANALAGHYPIKWLGAV